MHKGDLGVASRGILEIRVERQPPGHQPVQRYPQGVHVRSRVAANAVPLLGRHVVRRAPHRADLGAARVAGARNPEVYELHRTAGSQGGEQEVFGLDVVVGDARAPGGFERRRRLFGYADRAVCAEPAPASQRLFDAVGDVLHGEVVEAGLPVASDIEDGGDVGVVDLGEDARLAHEAFEHFSSS